MIKFSQSLDAEDLMNVFVAYLRALYQIHQNAHWRTGGPEFYGNHLLFERLYKGAQESADEAAERALGLFGNLTDQNQLVHELTDKFHADNFDGNWAAAALKAEQMFQAISHTIYNQIKNLKAMTLGLDDLIMSIASRHEVHVYLLKQTLEFSRPKVAE